MADIKRTFTQFYRSSADVLLLADEETGTIYEAKEYVPHAQEGNMEMDDYSRQLAWAERVTCCFSRYGDC